MDIKVPPTEYEPDIGAMPIPVVDRLAEQDPIYEYIDRWNKMMRK